MKTLISIEKVLDIVSEENEPLSKNTAQGSGRFTGGLDTRGGAFDPC